MWLNLFFQGLNEGVKLETRNMTIYSVVLVIVTLTCLALSFWYAKKLGNMLRKMAKHAQKIQVKSMELTVEKRRADTLLCQMLPQEVAEQLKMNREVKAEHRDVKVKAIKSRSCRQRSENAGVSGPSHIQKREIGHEQIKVKVVDREVKAEQ